MDKIEKKWPDNMELRNKVNELVEDQNKMRKALVALLKQAGWEEEDDRERRDGA